MAVLHHITTIPGLLDVPAGLNIRMTRPDPQGPVPMDVASVFKTPWCRGVEDRLGMGPYHYNPIPVPFISKIIELHAFLTLGI